MCLATLASISLFSSLVSTANLSPHPNNAPRSRQTLPTLSLPSNITNTTSPPANVVRIQCDSTRYGHDLNPHSCRNALEYVGQSDMQTTFAERHSGRPDELPLPWRIYSNDGLCFVQPLLLRGAATGHASSTELGRAAYTLFERCVVDKGTGGVAVEIGGDNRINVVVSGYAPHVRCDRTATPGPPWESCLIIVADMAATKGRKVFGDHSQDPRVEVNLPYLLRAIDKRCQASVEITGKSTSATWYEIWEAMSALSSMCARGQSKGGKAFGLGLRKNIFIRISDENPEPGLPSANIANVSTSAPFLALEASNAFLQVR